MFHIILVIDDRKDTIWLDQQLGSEEMEWVEEYIEDDNWDNKWGN